MPSSLRFSLPTSQSEEDKADLYFFPDILFYDLDENQYSAEWDKLNAARGGYLMVLAGKLCRVSIFQFLFQHIKGWFGFHNACHPDKIVMSAMKFFYFGYLSEYNQSHAMHIMRSWKTVYQPTNFFIQTGKTLRSNVTSTNMQRLLLHFYQTHLGGLQVHTVRPRDATHPSCMTYQFGQTYALRREWNAFTHLDPQNDKLIKDQLSFFSPTQETLPGSTCRQLYVTSQCDHMQAQLDKGNPKPHATLKTWHSRVDELLLLWPESKKNYLDFIIQLKGALAEVDESTRSQLRQEIHTLIRSYYSEELIKHNIQRYLRKNQAQTAYYFIEILQERNSKEALKIIEKNHATLYKFLQQDTDLGKGYAQKLVTNSKGVGTLFGLVGSGKYIKQAVALDPQVAYQRGATYCFKKHIKGSQWQAAFDLLRKHRGEGLADTELSVDDRRSLADHFIAEGNRLHTAARLLPATDYSSKEEKYLESLAMMALAVEVISEDKYLHQLHLHQRLCAQIMMDADKHRGGCTLERIELALHYIHAIAVTPCSLTDTHLTDAHIKILEEKIQLLHQLCLSPNTYESGTAAEPEHKLQCHNELQQLMETLDMTMMLWSKVSNQGDAKNRSRLAAVHFLKAECIQYFELPGNAKEHFHQACLLEPQHPYYHLRHAECYVDISKPRYDEESNKGIVLLRKQGVTATDYMRWFDDRWLLNKTNSVTSFCL